MKGQYTPPTKQAAIDDPHLPVQDREPRFDLPPSAVRRTKARFLDAVTSPRSDPDQDLRSTVYTSDRILVRTVDDADPELLLAEINDVIGAEGFVADWVSDEPVAADDPERDRGGHDQERHGGGDPFDPWAILPPREELDEVEVRAVEQACSDVLHLRLETSSPYVETPDAWRAVLLIRQSDLDLQVALDHVVGMPAMQAAGIGGAPFGGRRSGRGRRSGPVRVSARATRSPRRSRATPCPVPAAARQSPGCCHRRRPLMRLVPGRWWRSWTPR